MAPFASDVESFELIDARGELVRCSRSENGDLFALALAATGCSGS
jgi:hypothetical protein